MNENEEVVSSRALNRMFLVMFTMALVMFVVSGYAWFQLPADVQIPVHWGVDGNPDRHAGKMQGLLMLPAITLLMTVLIRIIPVIEPRRRNLLRSFVAYRVVGFSLSGFFFVLHLALIGNLLQIIDAGVGAVIGVLVSILIAVLGNYLGKVRSNFMFGIRTPWTLSSNLTWNKTHRLGGRLFVLVGIAGIVSNLLYPAKGVMIFTALLATAVLATVVYSYVIWRSAPDRRTE